MKLDTVLREALAPTIRELQARRWPASAPAIASTSTRCWWWAAAAGWPGCCRSSRRSWASPRAFRRCGRRWKPGGEQVGRRRGRGGGGARIRLVRAGRRHRAGRQPRLARDRLSPRAVRLPRQLLDPAPEGGAPGGAGRRAAARGRRSTSAPSVLGPGRRTQGAGQGPQDRHAGAVRPAARRRRGDRAAACAGAFARSWRRCPRRPRSICWTRSRARSRPPTSVKLDVGELDIRPKKTFIKGTVDTAAAVDEMAAKLKEIDCFEEVTKGAITEVSGGAKQFTLTIGAKCP